MHLFYNVIYSENKQRKYLNGKNKYLNHSVCAICEKKLKYLDKDEKIDWKKLKYLDTEEVEVFRQRRRGI
jgi:hypothetical protein